LTWGARDNIIAGLSRKSLSLKRISDAFAFSREGRVVEGTLALSSLERLHDLLADAAGEVSYRIGGRTGEQGESLLHLEVSGLLPLACQRCLEAVPFDLDADVLLELLPEGAEVSQDEMEDDTRDFLPVAGKLDVAELVEDEILLALPVAPRHEACGLPGSVVAGERIHPFAQLAGLRGKLN
jgi:uncharacterized protein